MFELLTKSKIPKIEKAIADTYPNYKDVIADVKDPDERKFYNDYIKIRMMVKHN